MNMRLKSKALAFIVVAVALAITAHQLRSQEASRKQLRLVVVLIAIDQFRYDYLTRFRDEYSGGFDRLLKNGANFVNANLEHYPTVTAVGHSTMLTGATPKISGIVGNDWYDRESGKAVTSVSDGSARILGGSADVGASPRRLLVSTVGDELKRARRDHAKVIGISLKDRSAILPSGHMADAAYWYDTRTGDFISSTYYFPELPSWVQSFNSRHSSDAYAGKEWRFGEASPSGMFKMPAEPGSKLASAVYSSPLAIPCWNSLRKRRFGRKSSDNAIRLTCLR